MATLRDKRKLAAVAREVHEECFRNSQLHNTSVLTVNVDYITQVSEDIEGRVIKNFPRTSTGQRAASKPDKFLLNPQVWTQSGTVPGTSPNTGVENQEPNEDRSQNGPRPEVGSSVCRSPQSFNSDPDEALHRRLSLYEKWLVNVGASLLGGSNETEKHVLQNFAKPAVMVLSSWQKYWNSGFF